MEYCWKLCNVNVVIKVENIENKVKIIYWIKGKMYKLRCSFHTALVRMLTNNMHPQVINMLKEKKLSFTLILKYTIVSSFTQALLSHTRALVRWLAYAFFWVPNYLQIKFFLPCHVLTGYGLILTKQLNSQHFISF